MLILRNKMEMMHLMTKQWYSREGEEKERGSDRDRERLR